MKYESPKYYVPTKEGLIKPETIEKIMKPFQDAVEGLTKEEKIEYLCLRTEIDTEEYKKTGGILRDVYMIASKIMLEDKNFVDSLTEEEKEKIKMSVNLKPKSEIFQKEQIYIENTENKEKEAKENGQSR